MGNINIVVSTSIVAQDTDSTKTSHLPLQLSHITSPDPSSPPPLPINRDRPHCI